MAGLDDRHMSPRSGRMYKENGTTVNEADILSPSMAIAGKTTVTTAGTPVTLGSQDCGSGITVIANPLNTGKIYVYPVAGVKTDVIPLAAGDSNFWPVSNISALKVDADVSGESVYWQGAV